MLRTKNGKYPVFPRIHDHTSAGIFTYKDMFSYHSLTATMLPLIDYACPPYVCIGQLQSLFFIVLVFCSMFHSCQKGTWNVFFPINRVSHSLHSIHCQYISYNIWFHWGTVEYFSDDIPKYLILGKVSWYSTHLLFIKSPHCPLRQYPTLLKSGVCESRIF